MRLNDMVFGVVLILFAIAEIAFTRTFPRLHGQDYGPDLFPIIIGAGLGICGLLLIAKGIASRAPMAVVGDWAQDRGNIVNVALLIGSLVFYILASDWLGFVLTSLLILTLLLVRLGTALLPGIGIAVVTTLVIHAIFAKLLLVPLPWGVLQPVAW